MPWKMPIMQPDRAGRRAQASGIGLNARQRPGRQAINDGQYDEGESVAFYQNRGDL
jgi:hypothetical protein